MKVQEGQYCPVLTMISFFFIFLPLFSHENTPIGLVNHIGVFSYLYSKKVLSEDSTFFMHCKDCKTAP